MVKVTAVFPGQMDGTDEYWIDYYYDRGQRELTVRLRGVAKKYYRVIFRSVSSFRSIYDGWAFEYESISSGDYPESPTPNYIFELHDADFLFPLEQAVEGRHFYIFGFNFEIDIHADEASTLEEISVEEAHQSYDDIVE